MALRAVFAELPVVLVHVTIHAIELCGMVDAPGVAANAVISYPVLGMLSDERESRVQVVVEGNVALAAFDMAIRTGPILELPLMGIAMRVAA